MSTRPILTAFLALASTAGAQTGPPPIEDNSFIIEEAYNQPRGVVQHISTFQRAGTGRGWAYTFTQEWPVPNIRHQLSYTVPVTRPVGQRASPRLGDLLLNYRYQVAYEHGVLFAPRLTAVLPTGSTRDGTGAGGLGVQANLPLTLELSPRWVTHSNVGGTLIPRGEDASGTRLRQTNLTLAQSVIYMPRATFNLMLEAIYSRTMVRLTPRGSTPLNLVVDPSDESLTAAPGFRFAINTRSGLQVVPGVAAPIVMRGALGSIDADAGLFLYLSFEHNFRR